MHRDDSGYDGEKQPVPASLTLRVRFEGTVLTPLLLALAIRADQEPVCRLADIGPAPSASLIDSAGKPFDLARLRGKLVLVSFIYTTCNGTCPATTDRLKQIEKSLKAAGLWGTSVEFVSITLDPVRDTPEALARYARIHDADTAAWHFLSGAPQRVQSVAKAWGIWVKRDSNGILDHSSRIFLLDQRGREREIYNLEFLKADWVLGDLRSLLAESARK
jgi:protein SCO1